MLSCDFEILSVTPVKGRRLEKTKDYEVQVTVKKDSSILLQDVIKVRKNINGIYPETEKLDKKIKSVNTRKEVVEQLKEYVKKK